MIGRGDADRVDVRVVDDSPVVPADLALTSGQRFASGLGLPVVHVAEVGVLDTLDCSHFPRDAPAGAAAADEGDPQTGAGSGHAGSCRGGKCRATRSPEESASPD